MQLTILGSGTIAVTAARSCSSYLLQADAGNLLFDIGPGAMHRMAEARVPYSQIDAVVLSHFHWDHIGDLATFLLALNLTPGLQRSKALTLLGPPGLNDLLLKLQEMIGEWLLKIATFPIEIREVTNVTFTWGGMTIATLPMNHSTAANGYRLEGAGASLVYLGDTGFCPNAIALARECDLLIAECSFPKKTAQPWHLTPELAGHIAAEASCKKVLLSHFYPMTDQLDVKSLVRREFGGEIVVAHDLMNITI